MNNSMNSMLRFESFLFTCLTYRYVQRFQNGPVHEFYGSKASQISKVCASSHKYPYVEKSRIFGNRISKLRWPTTVTAKELTSRQKEKPNGKKNNHDLTAKELRIKMSSRYRRNFATSLFLFAVTVLGHRTKVRQTTSNWIVRILYEATLGPVHTSHFCSVKCNSNKR